MKKGCKLLPLGLTLEQTSFWILTQLQDVWFLEVATPKDVRFLEIATTQKKKSKKEFACSCLFQTLHFFPGEV
jgi:hypothetical protein